MYEVLNFCATLSAALNSGQVGPSNVDDFSSYLQVSSSTLRSSYMSASANSAAHKIGNDVLGGVHYRPDHKKALLKKARLGISQN